MRTRLHQARASALAVRVLAAAFLSAWCGPAAAGAAPAETRDGASAGTRLAAECEQLLRVAVKTPYGWGWRGGGTAAGAGRAAARGAKPPTTIDLHTTAAAGPPLHPAGPRPAEEKNSHAA